MISKFTLLPSPPPPCFIKTGALPGKEWLFVHGSCPGIQSQAQTLYFSLEVVLGDGRGTIPENGFKRSSVGGPLKDAQE